MKIRLFAGHLDLGLIEAKIIDASMGVVGGTLQASETYFSLFQSFFRAHTQLPDWEYLSCMELAAFTSTNVRLAPAGGICITDLEGFDEIDVEICGISFEILTGLA